MAVSWEKEDHSFIHSSDTLLVPIVSQALDLGDADRRREDFLSSQGSQIYWCKRDI